MVSTHGGQKDCEKPRVKVVSPPGTDGTMKTYSESG